MYGVVVCFVEAEVSVGVGGGKEVGSAEGFGKMRGMEWEGGGRRMR